MESTEIRRRFLSFFEKRGHAVIPSASLIPENDASVLFTTAGMHPLVPYLLGEEHPKGKRLVDVQKCVRTGDLDDVGDNRHFTFFEMLGNWSLGDYFKEDAIKWSYEFLTSKVEGLGLDPTKLYVTVFEGNDDAPFDEESKKIWMSLGVPEHRIYALGAEDNWWSAGENGPCGPDTEMFYDLTEGLGDLNKDEFLKAVKREDLVEIWNDVFMEFRKENGKVVEKLKSKNVDTGAGLERMTAVMQGKKTAYDTDIFEPIFNALGKTSDNVSARIIADHIRASVFMISDGVVPSNTDQGYILRRLLRRSFIHAQKLGLDSINLIKVAEAIIDHPVYSSYTLNRDLTNNVIDAEIGKFKETLKDGLKQFEKGADPFDLFTTYGFPFELTKELANDRGVEINEEDFKQKFQKHQELSRAGAEQKFKGGLAGHSEIEVRYHTATHLLHQALRDVLGNEVSQKGSNITPERLRFDFSFSRKMTDEEKKQVEKIVNTKIEEKLDVTNIVTSKDEAVKMGALHFFDQKYPDQVSVYKIGDYSKEFCGGPHVKNTGEIGKFKIDKEEAVSAGVRRIKATLL
ncbi:MAG TPA: alanine--tRNA ligase [Parcubacteria group bacterium]|nr:alanine--tRNA ligase [Parcubacteria group bacterium]